MNIQTNDIAAPAIYSDKEIKEPSKIKTEFFRRYFRVVHILFAVLLLIQLLPDQLATETYASYAIWFAVGVEALTLIASALIKKPAALRRCFPLRERFSGSLQAILTRYLPIFKAQSG